MIGRMLVGILLGLVLWGRPAGASQAAEASVAPRCAAPLLVVGARVWIDGEVRGGLDVYVEAGRFAAIAEHGSREWPRAVRVIDARGALMLPGLVDAHIHVLELSLPNPERLQGRAREEVVPATLQATLASGVTAARISLMDVETMAWLREQVRDPCFPAPRLRFGGPGLFPGETTDRDGIVWRFTSVGEALGMLQAIAGAGAEWVSVHDAHRLDASTRYAIRDEAIALGMAIAAPGVTVEEQAAAADLGAQSLEYLPQNIDGAANTSVSRSVPVGGCYMRDRVGADPTLLDRPLLYAFMPRDVVALVRERQLASADRACQDSAWRAHARALLDSGQPLVLASDSGSPLVFHADAIWNEMVAWHEVGAPVQTILEAATARPARLLGMSEAGRIAPGASADFILYDGDFFAGDFDAANVTTVVRAGVLFVEDRTWVGTAPRRNE